MSECPAYRSKAYYDIVFGEDEFNGWRNIFAGDGTLIFEHDNSEQASFYGGTSKGWLERAWDQFTEMATSKDDT